MNRRTILLIVAFVVVVFGGIFAAILTAPHPTMLSKKVDLINLYATGVSFGQNTLLYADTDALITRNYVTGEIQTLNPNAGTNGLKNIDSLTASANKKYVLFHTTTVTPGTLLATILQNNKSDTTQDYWWVYSVDAQTFSPLPTGILMAKLSDTAVYGLAPSSTANSEAITTYDITTLKPTASIPVMPSTDFFATKSGFLLETTDNKTYLTGDGIVNYQVLSGATIIGITNDQQSVITTRADKSTSTIQLTNIQSKASQTIATGVVGQPLWSADQNLVLYGQSSNANQLATYNLVTRKTAKLQLASTITPSDGSSFKPTVLLDSTTFMATDTTGGIHLIGSNITTTAHIR